MSSDLKKNFTGLGSFPETFDKSSVCQASNWTHEVQNKKNFTFEKDPQLGSYISHLGTRYDSMHTFAERNTLRALYAKWGLIGNKILAMP